MPSKSRGVQDYEEHKKERAERRKKQRQKIQKWCSMAGLTILENFLCLICFILAYMINITVGVFLNVRYLMFPILLIIIACVFMVLTFVDIISWVSMRPVTCYAWIMVATSGFLFFFFYAGICVFYSRAIIAIVAIVFGVITALLFLADLICMLLSLKRFPVPYWILKRKYEKFDDCVCTGDYVPEEQEIERPICRCGDTWGEPCTCDAEPDPTCGCGTSKKDELPCPCCTCATQVDDDEEEEECDYGFPFNLPRKSIVTTASGRDYLIEEDPDPRKSTMVQVELLPAPDPDYWCVDEPARGYPPSTCKTTHRAGPGVGTTLQMPTGAQMSTGGTSMGSRKSHTESVGIATHRPSLGVSLVEEIGPRKSVMSRRSVAPSGTESRKSTILRKSMRSSYVEGGSMQDRSQIGTIGTQSRKSVASRVMPSYSVYTATVEQNVPQDNFTPSILRKHMEDGDHEAKALHPEFQSRRKSLNLSSKGPVAQRNNSISTDEEFGEGDSPRRSQSSFKRRNTRINKSWLTQGFNNPEKLMSSTYTTTEPLPSHEFMSDPESAHPKKNITISRWIDKDSGSRYRLTSLPGQAVQEEDSKIKVPTHKSTKNASVTAKLLDTSIRPTSYQRQSVSVRSDRQSPERRPRSEELFSRTIIRNVATTVRPVRILSRVMEGSHESRSASRTDVAGRSDTFPSECTITINKK